MILQREPKNGAEIMDAMESGSSGWWRPSPGSVYPMLKDLFDEGLVKKREDGRYEITLQGKEEVEWPSRVRTGGPRSMDGTLREISSNVSYLEDLAKKDDEGLSQNSEKIKEVVDRLTKLVTK